jgi:hypothetical protein
MRDSIEIVSVNLEAYFSGTTTKWNVIRYLLAAHYFFYWNLAQQFTRFGSDDFIDTPSYDEFCRKLEAKGLLMQIEIDALRSKPENVRITSLMAWCMIALRRIVSTRPPDGEKGNEKLHTWNHDDVNGEAKGLGLEEVAMGMDMRQAIIRIKTQMMTTAASLLCPFPFFCYHYVQVARLFAFCFTESVQVNLIFFHA